MRPFKVGLLMLCAMLLLVSRMTFALVEIPPLERRVTDLTGTLSPQQQQGLEAKLAAFEERKGSQIAVLIVSTTQPEEIAQYSIRVVEKWQIGREKSDDGLLLLIAKDDRKLRIEVGYGLEGAIPDLVAKRVIAEIIAPHFKQGDFVGGIDAGLDSLIKLVDGEPLPAPQPKQAQNLAGGDLLIPFLFGTFFLSVFLMGIFGRFFGSAATGGVMGLVASSFVSSPMFFVLGFGAFAMSLMLPWLFGGGSSPHRGGYYGRGYGGGYSGGGWSDSGSSSWGGGGGDFGGGGASGDW